MPLITLTVEIEILGMLAGILTTVSYVPQVSKVFKSKNVSEFSLSWLLMNFFGLFLWFIYGLIENSLGLILSTSITLVLLSSIIFFKFSEIYIRKLKFKPLIVS